MVRPLQPLDLLALVFFDGRANQARAWDCLDGEERALAMWPLLFRETLQPRGLRHTLVSSRRGRIGTLVSARRRSGPKAWEVDHLFLAPGQEGALPDNLEGLSAEAVRLRTERVFLRLPAGSDLLDLARAAGFCPYRQETLYQFSGGDRPTSPQLVRPKTPEDEQALFHLYGAATPSSVRVAEGMTLEEWVHSKEPWSCRELVSPGENCLVGWLRVTRRGKIGQFQALVRPDQPDKLGVLVDHCLGALRDQPTIISLVADYEIALASALEARGGRKTAEFVSLVRPLAARVSQPGLMPQQA